MLATATNEHSQFKISCLFLSNNQSTTVTNPPINRTRTWSRPPPSFFKINWGATCDGENRKMGFGAIIRDDAREVIGSLRAGRSFHVCPYTTEAYGLLLSILLWKNIGIIQLILEGDSLQVVNGMQHNKEDWSHGGCFIQDSWALINSFVVWSINHICRESNMKTHN